MAEEQADKQQETPGEDTESKQTSLLNDFIFHQRRAAEETYKAFESLLPPDFRTHSRVARDEFIESFRVVINGVSSVIDRELEHMRSTGASESGRPSTTGKSKVKVEVS